MPEGEAIEAGMVSRSIETAQRKVEARNFDIRKQLLEYDDVANDQRREIYRLRNDILEAESVADMVANLRRGHFTDLFRGFVPAESVEEQWNIDGLAKALSDDWQIELPLRQWLETEEKLTDDELLARVLKAADESYAAKVALVGVESFGNFESCCRSSTSTGASTWPPSTICARGSTCAATPRSSRSRSTSARRSSCSAR